jgi:hypothetical protein
MVASSIGTADDWDGALVMMQSPAKPTRITCGLQMVARMNFTTGTVPSLMLSDSGVSHYIDPDDYGCVDGSWQPDIPGLHLGDDSLIPAYGSCEKDYIDPGGGLDVRRRTLLCPDVAARVWSQGREVYLHKSKYVDAPGGAYYELLDGRRIEVSKSKNALRWVGWKVRPTEHSTAMQLVARSGRCMSMSTVTDLCDVTTVVVMNAGERLSAHTAGVGKKEMRMTVLQFVRPLWRVFIEVWGKFKCPSAQRGYVFYKGYTCEHNGMRWIYGSMTHTLKVVEQCTQRLRDTLCRSHPSIEFEIICNDWGDPKWAKEEFSKRGIDLTLELHPFWVISLANVDGDTSLPDDVGEDQPVVVVPAESTRHQVVDLLKQHVATTAVLPGGSTQLGAPTAVGDVSMAERWHTRSVPGQVPSGLKAMKEVLCKCYLVRFAGCKDSVASALCDLGASDGDEVDEIDIVQGGLAHNLSKFPNQSALLERVHNREFVPWRRTQTHVDGVPGLSVAECALVDSDTSLAVYCAVVALAANAVGTPWLIEQHAFRGDNETMARWKGCKDAPHMFQLREFQVLLRVTKPVQVVFPQCTLDGDSQKFTVLLGARSLTNALSPFRALQCTHMSHAEVLEGIGADGAPRTRAAAHYVMRMARLIAKVLRNVSAWVIEQQRSSDGMQLPSFGEVIATDPAAPLVPQQVVWPKSEEPMQLCKDVKYGLKGSTADMSVAPTLKQGGSVVSPLFLDVEVDGLVNRGKP